MSLRTRMTFIFIPTSASAMTAARNVVPSIAMCGIELYSPF